MNQRSAECFFKQACRGVVIDFSYKERTNPLNGYICTIVDRFMRVNAYLCVSFY